MDGRFQLAGELTRLPISAGQVLAVKRSRSDTMVSLPGHRIQLTAAILCLYRDQGGGAAMAMTLHLKEENRLVFYRYPVHGETVEQLLRTGDLFAESMGLQLDETGFGRMAQAQRTEFWESLPLRHGLERSKSSPEEEPTSAPTARPKAVAEATESEATQILADRKKALVSSVGRQLASM